MTDPAQRLLADLDTIVGIHQGFRAHGAAVLEGDEVVALAGFCGMTLAAPGAICKLMNNAASAVMLALTNDPYAGGSRLNHIFMIGLAGSRSVVTALAFRDFGAMRKDVFRHRAETFHEGLALSLLCVDWKGPERDVVLSVIATNVRDGHAARDVIDRVALATLNACSSLAAFEPQCAPAMPRILGRADGRAIVDESNGAAIDAVFDAGGGWRVTLKLDNRNVAEVARCSSSAIASAATLGFADGFGLPLTVSLSLLNVEDADVAAEAPEAVGEGTPLAYACYRATFDAVRKLSNKTSSPRDEVLFLARG